MVHFIERSIAALFGGVLDHFDFVELIATDHATLFGAVGTGFLTVARSIGEVLPWKGFAWENFVSMEVNESGLSGWEDELTWFHAFEPEDVFLKFWELTSGITGLVIENMWRKDHLITIREVAVDEVVK